MTTPNQKAETRPISFLFHNTATGAQPVKMDLVIRPEDLTRPDVSRAAVQQTLGGAWLDSWGEGVPSVQLSGTTGWGQGGRKDGQAEFLSLHKLVFSRWHDEREAAIRNGFDPDKVKLIFCDDLDEFTWVVAPMTFTLRRNKARPLLSQYQINLVKLADGVVDRASAMAAIEALAASTAVTKPLGFLDRVKASLASSLGKIKDFAAMVKGKIGAVLGPIQSAVADFTSLTATVLDYTNGVIAAGMGVVTEVTGRLTSIAGNLCRAGANIARTIQAVMTLPQRIKSEFAKVASAFVNAFCVLRNAFRGGARLPNFDDLYGASTCSSTSGGRPISRFDTENPFPSLLPINAGVVKVTSAAVSAVGALASMDPVLSPPSLPQMQAHLSSLNVGISVAA